MKPSQTVYVSLAPYVGPVGPVGIIVLLACPGCGHVTAVVQEWRLAHIGETHVCWNCNRWSDIPVLAPWERT